MKLPFKFNLRVKLLLIFLSFASLPIIFFAYWTVAVLNTNAENAALESLRGLAKTKAQAIESYSRARQSNLEKLSSLSDIVGNVKSLVQHKPLSSASAPPAEPLNSLEKQGGGLPQSIAEKRKEEKAEPKGDQDKRNWDKMKASFSPEAQEARLALNKTLNLIISDQKEYEEILIINTDGVVLTSTFDGHEGKTAKGIAYFQNGLKRTFFQHVFISSITEKLTMVISTPIKDETGAVLGVFAARLNLDLFFDFVEDLTGLGQTGETVVAKEIGKDIVFMAPTRHDFNAALVRKIPIGSPSLVSLQEASRGGRGSGFITDYRGILNLAAWEHIPVLDWGLMVKVDRTEAVQPYIETQNKTLLLTGLIILIGTLVSLIASHALVKPILELQDAADRISKGDMDIRLSVRSRDEIGDLADSFGRMIASVKFLLEENSRTTRRED